MRTWLAENEVDIVAFLRRHIPIAEAEAGRRLLVKVTNPSAEAEAAAGSFSPIRRALRVEDLDVLESYALSSERFTYEADQPVSWVRSDDDSRWEARRTHAPQSATWASHRSWISRPLGSGATRDDDVDAVDGWRFGPCMELFDDGSLWLWIAPRGVRFIEQNALRINGVEVRFAVVSRNKIEARCSAQVPAGLMEQILGGAKRPAPADGDAPKPAEPEGPVSIDGVRFHTRPGTPFSHPVTPLPAAFHRRRGNPITLRAPDQVRWWGDSSIAARGLSINGVTVTDIEPLRDGWHGRVPSVDGVIQAGAGGGREPKPRPDDRPKPELDPQPDPRPEPSATITAGMQIYSSSAVVEAIKGALGRDVRLFGRSVSDQAIAALTRDGLLEFLSRDTTDRINYVADQGGQNFDCENFSEAVRVNLARQHGVNCCAVIWGDGHAWCAFAIVGADGPEIAMVEPQSDGWVAVDELRGQYSVERRAEVLL